MPKQNRNRTAALPAKKRKRRAEESMYLTAFAGNHSKDAIINHSNKSSEESSIQPDQELDRPQRKKLEVDSSFIVDPSSALPLPATSTCTATSNNPASTKLLLRAGDEQLTKSGKASLSPTTKKKSKAQIFQDRIEQIKAFKLIHGHANPSQSYDAGLYRWCHRKRTSKSKLTPSQIIDLDDIGFNWGCKSYNMKSFEERIKELGEFQRIHKHCKVTVKYDVSLSVWCQHLKSSYRAMAKGLSPHVRLEREQIDVLNGMGFEW
jgi:hypothetical protein